MKPLEDTAICSYLAIYSSVLVTKCLQWQKDFRERETIRLCLKHFREQNYLEVSTRQPGLRIRFDLMWIRIIIDAFLPKICKIAFDY
jgi:hypothetical protein